MDQAEQPVAYVLNDLDPSEVARAEWDLLCRDFITAISEALLAEDVCRVDGTAEVISTNREMVRARNPLRRLVREIEEILEFVRATGIRDHNGTVGRYALGTAGSLRESYVGLFCFLAQEFVARRLNIHAAVGWVSAYLRGLPRDQLKRFARELPGNRVVERVQQCNQFPGDRTYVSLFTD